MKKLFTSSLLVLYQNNAAEYSKQWKLKQKNNNYTAFTNAKIFVTQTQIIEKELLIQGKRSLSAGNCNTSKNTIIVNLEGKSIYPS
jgi:hypothetical protein